MIYFVGAINLGWWSFYCMVQEEDVEVYKAYNDTTEIREKGYYVHICLPNGDCVQHKVMELEKH